MGKTDCIASHDISVKCHHFAPQNDGVLPHIIESYMEEKVSSLEFALQKQ